MKEFTGHNSPVMKARNRTAVLKLLLQRGPMARRDIAALLELTPATITNVARELIQQGLIEERTDVDILPVAVTKKPIPLVIRADGAFAIGINLGRTGIAVCVLDLRGDVRGFEIQSYTARRDPDSIVEQALAVTERLLGASEIDLDRLVGVGVGVAGVVDPSLGIVRSHLQLGWWDVELGDLMRKAFGRSVNVVNNVHSMAVCERLFGVASHARNFVEVYVSSIIGAAIVVDGELHRGLNAAAGLLGHLQVDPDGPVCRCGGTGCLEAIAGNATLLQLAREAIGRREQTAIHDLDEKISGTDPMLPIFEAAKSGDRLAIDLLRRQATYVGSSIASLLYLLDPELVVVTGPVIGEVIDLGGTDFLEIVRKSAQHQARLLNVPDSRIQKSRFGLDGACRGGAAVVLADFLDAAPFAERRRTPSFNGLVKALLPP